MLAETLNWWAARMAELAPAWLTRGQAAQANAVIIAAGETPGSLARLLLRRQGHETLLSVFIPGNTDHHALRTTLNGRVRERLILLRPPRGALLEKQLILPAAAERELRRVVSYEMNRVTPFEADDVFWTWTVEKHDRPRGRLHIRLSLVPKTAILPLLSALDQAGLPPTALEAMRDGGLPRLIPLEQKMGPMGWQHRAMVYLGSACGMLAIVALSLPFLLQSIALGTVKDRIAAAQPQVAQVQTLRQRIVAESAGRDAIADERLKAGNVLEILAMVTDVLPNDTFLNDLVLRQRRLTIIGQSAAAPKLIAAMASDPMFRNLAFAAPVTRNEAAKRDVFSIRTEIGP